MSKEIYTFLGEYLPILDKPTVVEIGTACAEDTPAILKLLQGDFTYYAFEPDPRNATVFRERITDPRVVFTQAAVGSCTGTTTLYMSGPDHVWSSSIYLPKEHLRVSPSITFAQTCEVPVVTLDDFFSDKNIETIDFLWCDAQGAELFILCGAKQTLPKIRYLFLEYSDIELYAGMADAETLVQTANQLTSNTGVQFEMVQKYDRMATEYSGDVLIKRKEA